MTIEECREYLPEGWTELIQQDPVLKEIFDEHEYDLEQEAVPPFLIQELRGGNIERLRPILSRYGQPGLELLQNLLEIDELSRDTAQIETPSGTAYAGYFFASYKGSPDVEKLVHEHIRAMRKIYTEVFKKEPPVDETVKIRILSGREGYDFRMNMHHELCAGKFHPGDDIYEAMGDWIANMYSRGRCGELEFLNEALYHINNDYMLSHFLRWPLLEHEPMENPFRPYFDLWRLGLDIQIPTRDEVVLID